MDVLGEGFFGTSLLDSGRACAVKWLGIRMEHAGELQQRIHRLIALEDTEHLVRYKDVGVTSGECWVSTEFCGQLSLEHFRGRLAEPALAQVVVHIIEALELLHRQQVVHGDLHPSNVFIDEEAGVRLSDYGVFDLLHRCHEEAHVLKHPLWWSAPERFASRERDISLPSEDIWALAAILIDLAEGEPRFSDKHPDVIKRQLHDGSLSLTLKTPGKWSMLMSNFVAACADIEPENRPSLSDLRNHRFLQLASSGQLGDSITAIRQEHLAASRGVWQLDPDDELERIHRMNVTFQLPYLPTSSFPPEAFQRVEVDENDETHVDKLMLPALKTALAYHRRLPFLSSEQIAESEIRAADIETVLKNIERR
mmetsp:Transcript_9432/g.28483  ORF Transcript_9432/g.28483 Transcript_9432/m.28483 type:complete len:367 (-) Transcript_9432:442-1542(-)